MRLFTYVEGAELGEAHNIYGECLDKHNNTNYWCVVFWSGYYNTLCALTDYPYTGDLNDEPIEYDLGFCILCAKAINRYIDYALTVSIDVNRPGRDNIIQSRIDLANILKRHLNVE